jgi:hypothetical protein
MHRERKAEFLRLIGRSLERCGIRGGAHLDVISPASLQLPDSRPSFLSIPNGHANAIDRFDTALAPHPLHVGA